MALGIDDCCDRILGVDTKLSPFPLACLKFLRYSFIQVAASLVPAYPQSHTATKSTMSNTPSAALLSGGNTSADARVAFKSWIATSPVTLNMHRVDIADCLERGGV